LETWLLDKGSMNRSQEEIQQEIHQIAAIITSTLPRFFRCRYCIDYACYAVHLIIERFNGVYWNTIKTLATGRGPNTETADKDLLKNYSQRSSWTESILVRNENITVKCPPAESVEELCVKLEILEMTNVA
jgi:hypothetical protein